MPIGDCILNAYHDISLTLSAFCHASSPRFHNIYASISHKGYSPSCALDVLLPTNPAANGIVPTATATVCMNTFSSTDIFHFATFAIPNASSALCNDAIVTHPVCSPKYVLLKLSSVPMNIPIGSERKSESFCGGCAMKTVYKGEMNVGVR